MKIHQEWKLTKQKQKKLCKENGIKICSNRNHNGKNEDGIIVHIHNELNLCFSLERELHLAELIICICFFLCSLSFTFCFAFTIHTTTVTSRCASNDWIRKRFGFFLLWSTIGWTESHPSHNFSSQRNTSFASLCDENFIWWVNSLCMQNNITDDNLNTQYLRLRR